MEVPTPARDRWQLRISHPRLGWTAGASNPARLALLTSIGHHASVSQYFQVGDLILWNPSRCVAELFVQTGEAVANLVDMTSGIGPMNADEYEIDMDAFVSFVDVVVERYMSSNHAVLRSLLEGFLVAAIVLVGRAGRVVSALHTHAAPEDPEHLQEKSDALACTMPR
jgi:hypothetical protein